MSDHCRCPWCGALNYIDDRYCSACDYEMRVPKERKEKESEA